MVPGDSSLDISPMDELTPKKTIPWYMPWSPVGRSSKNCIENTMVALMVHYHGILRETKAPMGYAMASGNGGVHGTPHRRSHGLFRKHNR